MKKNGFISIALIYSFFLIFLSLMVFLIGIYSRSRHLIEAYNHEIKEGFNTYYQGDIVLKLYILNSRGENRTFVDSVPDEEYYLVSKKCTNGAIIDFDEPTRSFIISTDSKTECIADFQKKQDFVNLHYYKEDTNGTHSYNELNYIEVEAIPGYGYQLSDYVCHNNETTTSIFLVNTGLVINTNGNNDCDLYFGGPPNSVDIIIMQEALNGEAGYTTGKLYSRTYGIPTVNYHYVGYKCDDEAASLTYENNDLKATSTKATTCYAYFDRG